MKTVISIEDRTATNPETRFDRVQNCLRMQCKHARLSLICFERICRSANCAETIWNGHGIVPKCTMTHFRVCQERLVGLP